MNIQIRFDLNIEVKFQISTFRYMFKLAVNSVARTCDSTRPPPPAPPPSPRGQTAILGQPTHPPTHLHPLRPRLAAGGHGVRVVEEPADTEICKR